MFTMIINSAVVTMTLETLCEYALDLADIAQETSERLEWHELWLVLESMDPSDPLYRDLYKDVWGIRPR